MLPPRTGDASPGELPVCKSKSTPAAVTTSSRTRRRQRASPKQAAALKIAKAEGFEAAEAEVAYSKEDTQAMEALTETVEDEHEDFFARMASEERSDSSTCLSSTRSKLSPQASDESSCLSTDLSAFMTTDAKADSDEIPVTTIMIRNLPGTLQQIELAKGLDGSGFAGEYDFLYLPSNFEAGHCKGYAFVNFVTAEAASRLEKLWHRRRMFGGDVNANLNISAAALQGKEANIARWEGPRMRRIRNPNYRPMVLDFDSEGVLVNRLQDKALKEAKANETALQSSSLRRAGAFRAKNKTYAAKVKANSSLVTASTTEPNQARKAKGDWWGRGKASTSA